MRACKECGKPIIILKAAAGKSMPCDQEQLKYCRGNNDTIVTLNGEVHKYSLD